MSSNRNKRKAEYVTVDSSDSDRSEVGSREAFESRSRAKRRMFEKSSPFRERTSRPYAYSPSKPSPKSEREKQPTMPSPSPKQQSTKPVCPEPDNFKQECKKIFGEPYQEMIKEKEAIEIKYKDNKVMRNAALQQWREQRGKDIKFKKLLLATHPDKWKSNPKLTPYQRCDGFNESCFKGLTSWN